MLAVVADAADGSRRRWRGRCPGNGGGRGLRDGGRQEGDQDLEVLEEHLARRLQTADHRDVRLVGVGRREGDLVHVERQDDVYVVTRDDQGSDAIGLVDLHCDGPIPWVDESGDVLALRHRSRLDAEDVGAVVERVALQDRAGRDLAADLTDAREDVGSVPGCHRFLHLLNGHHIVRDRLAYVDVPGGEHDRSRGLQGWRGRGGRAGGTAASVGDGNDTHEGNRREEDAYQDQDSIRSLHNVTPGHM